MTSAAGSTGATTGSSLVCGSFGGIVVAVFGGFTLENDSRFVDPGEIPDLGPFFGKVLEG